MSEYGEFICGGWQTDKGVAIEFEKTHGKLVRCKDCKWVGRDEHCPATEVYMICGDSGYCSYGERKEQDNE